MQNSIQTSDPMKTKGALVQLSRSTNGTVTPLPTAFDDASPRTVVLALKNVGIEIDFVESDELVSVFTTGLTKHGLDEVVLVLLKPHLDRDRAAVALAYLISTHDDIQPGQHIVIDYFDSLSVTLGVIRQRDAVYIAQLPLIPPSVVINTTLH